MRYANKKQYEWSADLAYAVGLIASDGCLQKDNRHIDLTSKDTEILDNFMLAIAKDLKISSKTNGSGKIAFRVQFSDVSLYDFLVAAGITPAKSKTIGPLLIPRDFYADFLRGYFDGDGTTWGFWDSRWKSSFMYYIAFASASLQFLEFLALSNRDMGVTTKGSIKKNTRAYTLVYSKRDSLSLYDFMYFTTSNLYLTRKKAKLERFIFNHMLE